MVDFYKNMNVMKIDIKGFVLFYKINCKKSLHKPYLSSIIVIADAARELIPKLSQKK